VASSRDGARVENLRFVCRSRPDVTFAAFEAGDHAVRERSIARESHRFGGIERFHHRDEITRLELFVDERSDGRANEVGIRWADVELVEKKSEDTRARLACGPRRIFIGLDGRRIGPSAPVEFDADDRPSGAVFEYVEICSLQAENSMALAIDYHHIAAHDRRREAAWRGLILRWRRHHARRCPRQRNTDERS
jgi:hypothetical protein